MHVCVYFPFMYDLLKVDPVPPYVYARRRHHKNARDYRRMLSWQRQLKKSKARHKLACKGR